MKEVIDTYPELKRLIGAGERVTMKGRPMTHAYVNDMAFIDVKESITAGHFEVEHKEAIEGEFIGKGDDPKVDTWSGNFDPRHAVRSGAQSQHQMNAANAAARQQALSGGCYGAGLGGLGSALFGGKSL